MRVKTEKIIVTAECSINIELRDDPCFEFDWHLHPEYELTLIVSSVGRRFVGDSIDDYRDGDLVLIGPNLAHTWCSTADHGHRGRHKAIVIQFAGDFLGEGFFARPEMRDVSRLLNRSAVGLCFNDSPDREYAARQIRKMQWLRGLDGLLALLSALSRLSRSSGARPLASPKFAPILDHIDGSRIDAVCSYINKHFSEKVSLAETARIAHMSPTAFSRFFSLYVGKTFVCYLNEIRIGHACRLLGESDWSITKIAYASGFSNISNFNRRFLRLKKMTPNAYRRQFTTQSVTG
jgi:AraC-like DNA-binding protein